MCGIAGFNWKDPELVKRMSSCIVHRGPDASGVFTDTGVSLAHQRLSVIDLSFPANQPMSDTNRELYIVYNGEIYNFETLKIELASRYSFTTKSDTEVILAGYRVWGRDVVQHLNGIFAFAIWDTRDNSLFCARDHMGVKPFYYSWDTQKFIFASEMKALFEHPLSRTLNLHAFNAYMRVLYVPEPETIVEGIYKLPPGSWLSLKGTTLEIQTYWKPMHTEQKWTYDAATQQTHSVVEKAVQRQLVADVPVGVYLSGGIDSSVVLSSVAKVKKNVKTFSIGFDIEESEGREKFNRDFDLARETSRYFGADHHPLTISVKDVANTLEETIGSLNDIISNPTAVPMMHLSQFVKKEVTVVLSGNGGDELFGGYERYRLSVISDLVGRIPGAGLVEMYSSKMKKLLTSPGVDRLALFEFEKDASLAKVLHKQYMQSMEEVQSTFRRYDAETQEGTDRLMLTDVCSWLPDQALALGDAMSMKHSVEERVPFLDREVADLALSLPREFKVNLFATKRILKDAFRSELPTALFREPKRGWFSPGAKWLRRPEIESLVRTVLSEEYYEGTATLFDWEALSHVLDDHISKKHYNLTLLWSVLTFQIWAKRYRLVVAS